MNQRSLFAGFLLLFASVAYAEDSPTSSKGSLADLSMEDLINIKVTSVNKKETSLGQSPAAISVITQEDIRHSGMTTLPELLRMVPGLDVARINGNQWAVSSRGFNSQYANKMLVLVDGRAVYTPVFGGVFWNAQDLVLEDVDRIEVIRGPGATLWGANAVNGVINITTKSAKETQGGLVSTSFGTEDQPSTTLRYGGQLGTNLYYRVNLKYFNREGFVDPAGKETPDDWRAIHGGARLDWEPTSENRLTLQGDYYGNTIGSNIQDPTLTPPSFVQSTDIKTHNSGGNILSRWTHDFSQTSQIALQSYYDHLQQADGFTKVYQSIYDVDLQHRFALGDRNDILWGAGYRLTQTRIAPSFFASATPASRQFALYSAFLQDDLTVVPDQVHLTLGTKLEHNDFTGWEFQPSGRLLWTPAEHQTVWASVSRALRTPTVGDHEVRANAVAFQPSPLSPPILVASFGSPSVTSEELISYELGYRTEPVKRLSFDLVGFYNVYHDLIGYAPGPLAFEADPTAHLLSPVTAQNNQAGETYGAELSVTWQVAENWRLVGSYTRLHMRLHPDSSADNDSPREQFQLRSYLDLPHNLELNGSLFYVGPTSSPSGQVRLPVASYFRFDVGVMWHPTKALELGIWGQNLLDNQHPEFNSIRTSLQTEVPRSVLGKITWHF